MKQNSNTNFKRYMTNRLFSVLFVIVGGSMVYFATTIWSSNLTSGITCLCAAVVFVIFAIVITFNLYQTKLVAKALNGHSSLSVDEFTSETNIDPYLALNFLNAAFNGQYVVGYVDTESETIILKNSPMFNNKRYRQYLTNGQ